MKQNRVSPRRRAPRTDAARRAQLLAAYDRSGLSAADFASQQRVHYTTFCGWPRRTNGRGSARNSTGGWNISRASSSGSYDVQKGRNSVLRGYESM